jgi:hypothetical protein
VVPATAEAQRQLIGLPPGRAGARWPNEWSSGSGAVSRTIKALHSAFPGQY